MVQLWLGVGADTVMPGGGAASGGGCTVAVNVSDSDRPLLSEAITLSVRLWAVIGAVPLNVSVPGLKVSHPGSAAPVERVAA